MRRPPPSKAEWQVDGELHGHSVEQTLACLSDVADFEDEQVKRLRALRPGVILAGAAEPRWVTRLRFWCGRV